MHDAVPVSSFRGAACQIPGILTFLRLGYPFVSGNDLPCEVIKRVGLGELLFFRSLFAFPDTEF